MDFPREPRTVHWVNSFLKVLSDLMTLLFLIDSISPLSGKHLLLSYINSLKECTYTFLLFISLCGCSRARVHWEGFVAHPCTHGGQVDARCCPWSFLNLILLR